jgi:hypothetical protein
MLMRYHWGLGVGHTYAHQQTKSPPPTQGNLEDCGEDDGELFGTTSLVIQGSGSPALSEFDQSSDSDEGWVGGDGEASESDDDELIAMDEMYND